jgi:hypothetical protein
MTGISVDIAHNNSSVLQRPIVPLHLMPDYAVLIIKPVEMTIKGL